MYVYSDTESEKIAFHNAMVLLFVIISIITELAITIAMFLPFLEWPVYVKILRMPHLFIGLVFTIIGWQILDFGLLESFFAFGMWFTSFASIILDAYIIEFLPEKT